MGRFIDNEYPSGLDESIEQHYPKFKNISAQDLSELLKPVLKKSENVKRELEVNINSLKNMGNKIISVDVKTLVNMEKELVDLHNKLASVLDNVKEIK